MAFMGLMFVEIALIIFLVILFFMIVFFVAAIILKIIGKKKSSKPMRVVGNVFLVLGILNAIPVVFVTGLFIFNTLFTKVEMPNGETVYVLSKDLDTMQELALRDNDDAMRELDELLTDNPEIIHYFDINCKNLLDYGLESGNFQVVKIALEHGAVFDDTRRYDRMAYTKSSMDFYLGEIIGREITDDDVEIIRLMFENNASTGNQGSDQNVYSNMFGKAVWAVLYNDETVTDTEIEFIQIFIDNNLTSDSKLLLYDEKPNNVFFSSEYHADVLKDDNYNKMLEIIGK